MSTLLKEERPTSVQSSIEGQPEPEQPQTQEGEEDESGDTNLYPPPSAEETKDLQEIFDKEYAEGDAGRVEALNDLQNVFDELEKQKVICGFDILTPYNTTRREEVTQPSLKMNIASNRMLELTPRSSVGLFGRDQSEIKISSLPNLNNLTSRTRQSDLMKDATASLPTLASGPPKQKPLSKKSKSKKSSRHKSSHKDGGLRTSKGPEICVSDAIDIVQKDLELATSTEFRQPPSFTSLDKDVVNAGVDIDEAWKADVNKVTRARTSSKPFTRSGEDEILQLKYKPPIWPHQQCLNQILARVSRLTCLILDGSEIQFLRDLGSSLQALETLSICKCGLRSVDGTFGFPNLRTFIASDNKIKHPSECSYLPYLNYLDLSGNPIEDIKNFVHLRSCKRLRSLKLHTTPVSKTPDFSRKMKRLLPQVTEVFPISTYMKVPKPKNSKKEDEATRDPLQVMMRKDLNKVYKKIVDHPKPPGIGYQHFRTTKKTEVSFPLTTTPGTETSTDDNFESVLINSIRNTKARNDALTTESYITEVDEDESVDFTVDTTSATPGQGEWSTDFSFGDARNLLNTGSSIPIGDSMEEIFMLRKQKTSTEMNETETDEYGGLD